VKIRSFNIKNFKSLEDISVDECSDFHALIGANSAGKTSIFDALNLIKSIGSQIQATHLITNGIGTFDTKSITVDLKIELDDVERRDYLLHSFHIPESNIDSFLKSNILSEAHLVITILIHGSKVEDRSGDQIVFPSLLEITTFSGISRMIYLKNNQVLVKQATSNPFNIGAESFENKLNAVSYMSTTVAHDFKNMGVFSSNFLTDLLENIRYIQAIRETDKTVASAFFEKENSIGERGEKLANFMETLWANDDERFRQIEKFCKVIFPNIEKIRTKKLPGNEIIIEIHKKNINTPITLKSEGRGLDQALVVIWRIAASPAKTIWLVDEPEIHLHPGAQKLLYEFFQDEISRGKQIIVSTHSMVFIHRCEEIQISVLLYKDGITELSSLQNLVNVETSGDINRIKARDIIYYALGYDSSQSLEYTTIVTVEGKTDEKIFKIFANTLGKPIDLKLVKFIPVGNKKDAKRFTPVLRYTIAKKLIIILDNDDQDPEQLKQSIQSQESEYKKKIGLEKSLLKDEEFCLYDKDAYSIESYLLDAEAIGKSGSLGNDKIEEIKKRITIEQVKEKKDREKPKTLLSNIWSDFGLGNYDDESPEKIAKNMSKLSLLKFPKISEIIDKINGNYSE